MGGSGGGRDLDFWRRDLKNPTVGRNEVAT